MKFSRQEYCSGLPFPSPGDLSNSPFEPRFPSLEADILPFEPPGKPYFLDYLNFCHKLTKKEKSRLEGHRSTRPGGTHTRPTKIVGEQSVRTGGAGGASQSRNSPHNLATMLQGSMGTFEEKMKSSQTPTNICSKSWAITVWVASVSWMLSLLLRTCK